MAAPDSPNLDRLHVLDAEGGRRFIYPADVSGRFTRRKNLVFVALIAIYVVMPWVRIGGQPAILIDIADRHFYLFGNSFNAQDFYLVFFLLTGIGFALFMLAALAGRIWCGWACPQTVFLEGVFRRIERWIEGPAQKRRSLDQAPWSLGKLAKKTLKHALYLVISFALAHVFLAYFVSMPGLLSMVRSAPGNHLGPFVWAVCITAIIYANFFWFREQLCLIICPYGRLQSALQDRDTLVIGYDRTRGEPRGKLSSAGPGSGAGDCVDCHRCVAVCPTDIDIRNGLQMECVGCANCVDACDEIMVRLGRKKGLIRYDSERGFVEGKRRILRPRLYAYLFAAAVGLTVASFTFGARQNFEANLLHTRGMPYVIDGDLVRNQIMIHLINKNPVASTLSIAAAPGRELSYIIPQPRVSLPSLGSMQVPIFISVRKQDYRPGMQLSLVIHDQVSQETRTVSAKVMGPPPGALAR
jgi:cytochrome c oxidase accessory protein FixG